MPRMASAHPAYLPTKPATRMTATRTTVDQPLRLLSSVLRPENVKNTGSRKTELHHPAVECLAERRIVRHGEPGDEGAEHRGDADVVGDEPGQHHGDEHDVQLVEAA